MIFFPQTNAEQQVKILELQDKLSKVGIHTLVLILFVRDNARRGVN